MRRSFIILLTAFFFSAFIKIDHYDLVSFRTYSDTVMDIEYPIKDSSDTFICRYPIEPDLDWKEWRNYLMDNVALDPASLDTIPPGCYIAVIQFVINKDGSISDVSIQKDPGYGLGKRALDIISQFKSRRTFSTKYMETYRSYRSQPITFTIEEEDEQTREECKESFPVIIP